MVVRLRHAMMMIRHGAMWTTMGATQMRGTAGPIASPRDQRRRTLVAAPRIGHPRAPAGNARRHSMVVRLRHAMMMSRHGALWTTMGATQMRVTAGPIASPRDQRRRTLVAAPRIGHPRAPAGNARR